MSTQQNLSESGELPAKSIDDRQVADRIEGLVSLGMPTCDVCYNLSPDDRPEAGEFWPENPIHYVNTDGETLYQWMGTTVCEFHDTAEHRPAEATHRVVDSTHYVGNEPDRGNSDYLHNVQSVEVLNE